MSKTAGYYDNLTYGNLGNPFMEAKLRIKRAQRHLSELTNAARELPKRHGYSFVIAPRPEHGNIDIIFMSENPMPMEFGAVVGDAIHNIRAAFDYVAIVISCPPYGTGNPNEVYFPTGKTLQKFIKARKEKMNGAGVDALQIVEELEPYNGGKHSIRALHDLDIRDKHKLLIPSASRLHVNELEVMFGDKLFSLAGTDFHPNENETNFIATIHCPAGVDPKQFKPRDKYAASFTAVFGKGQPLEGQEIIPTLLELCEVAKGLIKRCEEVFV